MKHIKIYEEYSDDELKDLMGDLETVGHKHRFIQGEDFGFGPDLKGENDGKTILFLTRWAVEQLGKTSLVLKTDKTQFTWPKWAEYTLGDYDKGIPTPKLRKAEDLASLDYPPKMGFSLRKEPVVDKDLYMILLSSTKTGRSFPVQEFDSAQMFISPKKVAPIYDMIVNKLKSVNI